MGPFRNMYGHQPDGHPLLTLIFLVLVLAAVVWLVVMLVRERNLHRDQGPRAVHGGPPPPKGSDALRILDERFARGEIDPDDYKQRRALLSSRPE